MTQRTIDLALSMLAALAGLLLSWPYFRQFRYWAVSEHMWWLYFALGYVLAVFVFLVFITALRTLFTHDALVKSAARAPRNDGKAGKP